MSDRYPGYDRPRRGVEASAQRLKRLYLVERELMRALGAWHMAVSNWELKALTPEHLWHDSRHADALRDRVLELRYPRRDVEADHDPALTDFLAMLPRATTDAEFARGVYEVVKPALVAAYDEYLAESDVLNDAPSRYVLKHILLDERDDLAAAAPVLAGLDPAEIAAAEPWVAALTAHLTAIGGLLGDGERSDLPANPAYRDRPEYVVPERAVRDPRFALAVVESPQRPPATPRERQIWYAIDHANEVWAAEVPGAFMWAFRDQKLPWNFYTDVARWSYDEMRHCLGGIRRLEDWGFVTGQDYPMVGDPYHAILEEGGDLIDVLALLYYFEKDAPAHRQHAHKEFSAIGDPNTVQDTDYDWADEAIHLKYGYTWLQHLLGPRKDDMPTVVADAGAMWDRWLDARWTNGEDGYAPFMARIDANIAAAQTAADAASTAPETNGTRAATDQPASPVLAKAGEMFARGRAGAGRSA